ncbi:hypothetical protein V5O48_017465 [Marasmius crinis-equi]|uniref:N2227-like protein n=1 Tax=Marasmius crinis-equi TaxID=585013 RepID=A0ABR3EP49_9AGAR
MCMPLDLVLACFLPILIVFFTYKLSPSFPSSWSELRSLLSFNLRPKRSTCITSPFSLSNAYHSYLHYRQLSASQHTQTQQAYALVNHRHKRIGYEIGYPAKLKKMEETTEANAVVTDGIARLAEEEFPSLKNNQNNQNNGGWNANAGNVSRVRESLKHFIRDWSVDGVSERETIFLPILDVLKLQSPESERPGKKVLIPGSGLGRLAWEIAQLGFDTTANEISGFMNLAFRFLLSPKTTWEVEQHVLHPYCYWWSHQRSNEALFRGVKFPDVVPRVGDNLRLHFEEGDFLALNNNNDEDGGYDYIVTLFFIDTSTNILSTLEQIHALLRPGGTWINLGPLLWCSGNQARLELSLEEVWEAARKVGFTFVEEEEGCMKPRTVPCEYTGDEKGMMKWIYQAEFWVARK